MVTLSVDLMVTVFIMVFVFALVIGYLIADKAHEKDCPVCRKRN